MGTSSTTKIWLTGIVFAVLPGCGVLLIEDPIGDPAGGANDLASCPARLLPGDLVITEIMAHPAREVSEKPSGGAPGGSAGPAGREWIEFFNPTGIALQLEDVVLRAGPADGSAPRHHVLGDLTIASGGYLVVGSGSVAVAPIDHAHGGDLGELDDDGGRVSVACDVIEVDAVVYGAMSEGVAHELIASVPPDYAVNDDPGAWCEASTEYAAGSFGSPGGPGRCDASTTRGTCDDSGTRREVRRPGPGDVVITEIMANPDAVSDSDGEWVEIHARAGFDLNGLGLGREPGGEIERVIESERCLPVAAGSHAVLAASDVPEKNGGLARVDALLDLSLGNSRGHLFIALGDTVLDEVSWTGAAAGVSNSLDPDFVDVEANDRAEYWCDDDTHLYGAGDSGTPGQVNRQCAIVIPGMCEEEGTLRPVVSPGPGEIALTEFMANPDGISDTTGEWIEIAVLASEDVDGDVDGDREVDLNGLELGREPGVVLATIEASRCLRVAPGAYVVVARGEDPANNGGLPRVDATFGFGLLNSNSGLFVGIAGEVLDSLTYASSAAGAATARDPDDAAIWCTSTEPYGDGSNHGTPGVGNPPCDRE